MSEAKVTLVSIYSDKDEDKGYVALEVLQWLYRLLEERDPIANISHKKMPVYPEHVQFVLSKPYLGWYIVNSGTQPVGTVYLTKNGEIGVFIKNGFKGKGYGRAAVSKLMNMYCEPFYANIAPGNVRSQQFFRRLGFRELQTTLVKDDG